MNTLDRTAMGFLVPESKFKVEDIPDLSGKVAIVTGANVSSTRILVRVLLIYV
jgi:retinol dehydrogenase-12